MANHQTPTPGPWYWEVNPGSKSFSLRAPQKTGTIVMDFVRYGMGSALPRFRVNNLMENACNLIEIDPQRDHHKAWHQLLSHPDAQLIASAPDLLECLIEAVADAERGRQVIADANREMGFNEPKKQPWVIKAEAAIRKALSGKEVVSG